MAVMLLLGSPAAGIEVECPDGRTWSGSELVECPCCKPCGDGLLLWSDICPEPLDLPQAATPVVDEVPAEPAEDPEHRIALALGFWIAVGYFLPAAVARLLRHERTRSILMLNLLLGWTVIGWIFAFVWAFVPVREVESW